MGGRREAATASRSPPLLCRQRRLCGRRAWGHRADRSTHQPNHRSQREKTADGETDISKLADGQQGQDAHRREHRQVPQEKRKDAKRHPKGLGGGSRQPPCGPNRQHEGHPNPQRRHDADERGESGFVGDGGLPRFRRLTPSVRGQKLAAQLTPEAVRVGSRRSAALGEASDPPPWAAALRTCPKISRERAGRLARAHLPMHPRSRAHLDCAPLPREFRAHRAG